MESAPKPTRRMILKGLGGAAAFAASGTSLLAEPAKSQKWKIEVFTKPFQSLSYEETAETVAELGFDGIEGTVRGGGHVLPENVARDLPRFAKAIEAAGLDFSGMVTHIKSATAPHTQEVLEAAASVGIKRYRMDYFHYNLKKPIPPQIDGFRRQVEAIAKLNAEIGIQGLYQNHAGAKLVGAGLWDLDRILADCDPAHLGVAFDLRHAKVEAGLSWPVGYSLLKQRIGMFYVKDFRWNDGKLANVPLGEGIVGGEFYRELAAAGDVVPVSLHIEYGNKRDPLEASAGLRKDIKVLRRWLG